MQRRPPVLEWCSEHKTVNYMRLLIHGAIWRYWFSFWKACNANPQKIFTSRTKPPPVFNKEVLAHFHSAVKRKRPEIADHWKFHQSYAPLLTAFIVNSYLTVIAVSMLLQPRYRFNLTPTDYMSKDQEKPCSFHLTSYHRLLQKVTAAWFHRVFAMLESR